MAKIENFSIIAEPECRSRLRKICPSPYQRGSDISLLPSADVDDLNSYMHNAVPLRDVLTGIFNGSPIPPDYLGEPHEDTDDTDISEVDPYGSFGYSRLDREQFAMDLASKRVDAEGHRARTARSRTANPTGDLGGKSNSSAATTTVSE